MNISEFNKQLGIKVAKARGLENRNKLKEAIKTWLDVSEMTLMASKTPNLNSKYRNMLIQKTKEILEYVKELKSEVSEPIIPNTTVSEKGFENIEAERQSKEAPTPQKQEHEPTEPSGETKPVIKKDSEYKNIPKGFKELDTSEDFEVLTPYDKKGVEERLKDPGPSSDYFKQFNKQNEGNLGSAAGPNPADSQKDTITCFACGVANSADAKTCKNCGIELQ